ncbi:HIT family protein [Roseivirga sp. UBA1976]|uniref:HIT family protein n=1 Tax=Roseivirga sp. UBA1976 TaxID=1947386 RepID=UPI00257CCE88|nr:HIT family protein [Roseivirga sp. UBA1976]MEC7754159.1 HIT family protein [Bacteroidota bacterium]|tara:strand:- start:13053 stop:13445 length:393 start_codon:yes stop_codon:yes gene_type:complete
MASIFTKIINREIPGHIVAENDHAIAFLDINPLNEGHTLVVPKKEIDKLFDLDEDTYLRLQAFTFQVAKAIEKAIPCLRVGVAVVGLEVPHAHIHLIPLHGMHDIDFGRPKLKLSPQQFEDIRQQIASHL